MSSDQAPEQDAPLIREFMRGLMVADKAVSLYPPESPIPA